MQNKMAMINYSGFSSFYIVSPNALYPLKKLMRDLESDTVRILRTIQISSDKREKEAQNEIRVLFLSVFAKSQV